MRVCGQPCGSTSYLTDLSLVDLHSSCYWITESIATEELRLDVEADCLEDEFVDAPDGTRSISVLLVEVLEHDVVQLAAPEIPEDDDFLGALIDTALAPFLGEGPRTFSDFLTPERQQQLMVAQKPNETEKADRVADAGSGAETIGEWHIFEGWHL